MKNDSYYIWGDRGYKFQSENERVQQMFEPGNKEKSKYLGSLRVKVRERKRDYEVPLKLTSAARWITSKQLQRATS